MARQTYYYRMSTAWGLEQAATQHSTSKRLAALLPGFLPSEIPVVDYGCGTGFYVDKLRSVGFDVTGLEGTQGINEIGIVKDIIEVDLSKPLEVKLLSSTSLCLEVAEHIDSKFEKIFLDNITKFCNRRLILSWATPHQGGDGHINERDNLYVIETMRQRDFIVSFSESCALRKAMHNDICWWFENSIMIFDRV